MKVLLTTPTFPPQNSGLGNAVLRQAQQLSSAGVNVVVATFATKRSSYRYLNTRIQVEGFNIAGAESFLLDPLRGDIQAYVDFLKDSSFDSVIMHAWQNWATDLVLRHSKDIHAKKYLYSHGLSLNYFSWDRPLRSLLRYALWRAYWWHLLSKMKKLNGIIFLSNSGDSIRFADLIIAKKNQIPHHVIPNCLAKEAVTLLDQPAHARAVRHQLISVGSYTWLKGFDFVLQAYARSTLKNKVVIKFFGQEHTPYTKQLMALTRRLGIQEGFVQFFENVSGQELLIEYTKSIMLLSGSRTECQPLVLLDANATGTPFVARRTGCIDSMPGGSAVDLISEAVTDLEKVFNDGQYWQALSDAGRQAAMGHYHPSTTLKKILQLLST